MKRTSGMDEGGGGVDGFGRDVKRRSGRAEQAADHVRERGGDGKAGGDHGVAEIRLRRSGDAEEEVAVKSER
jgi:hypothetical protein